MDTKNKIKVVIIDDNDMIRTLLKVILRSEQFDVVGEAEDGKAAIEVCLKFDPDIVLLDIAMPLMNGIDALAEIRLHLPCAVIIMVTANDDENIINEAIKKGASGYVVKPFNTLSVIETMTAAKQKFILRNPVHLQESRTVSDE
jgi:two-component system chemotaxis response regulator CheY